MPNIETCELPATALLQRYAASGYADCYVCEVPGAVSHAAFVRAFYTSPLFRVERTLLRWFAARPANAMATDADAAALAAGTAERFAAWSVEARAHNQLLLADFSGRTRSWLMVQPGPDTPARQTRLYFGSAVVPRTDPRSGQKSMGAVFSALLGFHKLYSRALLRAASRRVPA